jgi:hypothetical protein
MAAHVTTYIVTIERDESGAWIARVDAGVSLRDAADVSGCLTKGSRVLSTISTP